MRITNWIRTIYKRSLFQRRARVGTGFSVGPQANCSSEHPDNIVIGDHCEILGSLLSVGAGTITIGNHSEIRGMSRVGSMDRVTIGNYVIISNNVSIYDNNHHPTDPETRKQMCIDGFYGDAWSWKHAAHKPVVIGDNVWIGEGSTILKGVTIGEGSIIGCHSVVTRDVPPYTIAAGNPAKVVKHIERKPN